MWPLCNPLFNSIHANLHGLLLRSGIHVEPRSQPQRKAALAVQRLNNKVVINSDCAIHTESKPSQNHVQSSSNGEV